MRKFLAGISNCAVALAVALLAVFTGPSSPNVGLSDASGSHASAPPGPAKPACGSDELVVYHSGQPPCEVAARAQQPKLSTIGLASIPISGWQGRHVQ
jgi:hypothetical protein